MTLRVLIQICLFSLLAMMTTSCASSKKYGNRNSSYTKSRTARSNQNKPAKSNDDYLAVVDVKNDKKGGYDVPSKKKYRKPLQNDDVEKAFREGIYETGSQYIGLKYRSGGRAPNTGFDCSGFVSYVMGQSGIKIGGSSISMSKLGLPKDKENLQIGDLVFFGRNGNIHHVGIVSNNVDGEIEMIHSASSTGISVDIIDKSDYWRRKFMFGRDIITPHLEKPADK